MKKMKIAIAAIILIIVVIIVVVVVNNLKEERVEPLSEENVAEESILEEFTNLYTIPRGSDNTKAISNYLKGWAKENNINVTVDKFYNVIMEKPATEGYEHAPTTILQSNMDMRYIKSPNITYDPTSTPIAITKEDGLLRADGINLGADSGAGMATALYVMKTATNHGPLKAIFTANKEADMLGSRNLDPSYLNGDYLINLNHTSDSTLCNSSAGYSAFLTTRQLTWQPPSNNHAVLVSISNLKGGDSGVEIDNNHANALKVLGTLLAQAQSQGIVLELASINGGISDSIIPSEASAVIILNDYDVKKFKSVFNKAKGDFKKDFGSTEKDADFLLTEGAVAMPEKVLSHDDTNSIISYLYGIINGVYSMSPDIRDFVQSSANIGTANTFTGNFTSDVLIRSSSDEKSAELVQALDALCQLSNMNYTATTTGPAWKINPNSTLTPAITSIYKQLYGKNMTLQPVHASSECGWFSEKNPNLDIISIGFGIENVDTPTETLKVSTLTRPAEVILQFLTDTKKKMIPPKPKENSSATSGSSVTTDSSLTVTPDAVNNQ